MQLQCQIPKEGRKCWGDRVSAGGRQIDGCRLASIRRAVISMDIVKGCLVWGAENETITKLSPWGQLSSWTPPQAAIDL